MTLLVVLLVFWSGRHQVSHVTLLLFLLFLSIFTLSFMEKYRLFILLSRSSELNHNPKAGEAFRNLIFSYVVSKHDKTRKNTGDGQKNRNVSKYFTIQCKSFRLC